VQKVRADGSSIEKRDYRKTCAAEISQDFDEQVETIESKFERRTQRRSDADCARCVESLRLRPNSTVARQKLETLLTAEQCCTEGAVEAMCPCKTVPCERKRTDRAKPKLDYDQLVAVG